MKWVNASDVRLYNAELRRQRRHRWHKWFAWHPVAVNTRWPRTMVWLETVERRKHPGSLFTGYEFRELN